MKHVISILKFGILFLIFYYGFYWLLFNVSAGNKLLIQRVQEKIVLDKDVFGRSWKEFDRKEKYDFIFLGSSHAYRCFDPAIFSAEGFNCYNLGSSSQTPLNSFAVLGSVVENTRAVLLEIYPVASGLSGEESFLRMNASVDDYNLLAKSAWHLNSLRCYNILSVKPLIDQYNTGKPFNIEDSYLGYVQRSDTLKPDAEYKPIVLNTEYVNIQKRYIRRIIELCASNKLKLAFVYAPVPSKLIIEGETDFLTAIDSIAKENSIPFYNYSRAMNLKDDQHFFDQDHLNKAGVEMFNAELLSRIARDAAYFQIGK